MDHASVCETPLFRHPSPRRIVLCPPAPAGERRLRLIPVHRPGRVARTGTLDPSEPPSGTEPPRRPNRVETWLGSLTRRSAFLIATTVALVVVLVAVGALARLRRDSEQNAAGDTRSTGAAAAPQPSASASTASPAPSVGPRDSWKQAWSTDLDLGADAQVEIYANSDYVVVYDWVPGERANARLRGYSLAGGRPQELWSTTSAGQPTALTSSALVLGGQLIDPATGETTDAPWGASSYASLVTDDLIITCATRPSPACTGWDLDGGALIQRWGPVAFPGTARPRFNRTAVTGDTHTGYALAEVHGSFSSEESVAFVSLADGSIQTRPDEEGGEYLHFVPAADGWLQLGAAPRSVTALEPDGTEIETYGSVQNMLTLLLTDSDSGLPTVEQYKSTFTLGGTSWASIAFSCHSRSCTLNGQPLTGADDATRSSLMYEFDFTATANERYLVLSHDFGGKVRIIDRDRGGVVPQGDALYGSRTRVKVVRADLLIAVEDGSLVAYTPPE